MFRGKNRCCSLLYYIGLLEHEEWLKIKWARGELVRIGEDPVLVKAMTAII